MMIFMRIVCQLQMNLRKFAVFAVFEKKKQQHLKLPSAALYRLKEALNFIF